ncbi:transposase [Kribbella aluminosa]|uniref:Transposase n=1 Tax=Kribbella aluminosa TaxID=416017 RepID=A0ABS4UYA4_9ACTN|nr:IS110 family transposase [Kribbella aluminosa]MBP2356597.1 transposase [Kribbella aluminosa]
MELILGIDLACRAAHQASLARSDGTFVWTGRKFFTRPADLEALWAAVGLAEGDVLRVVMEPTRNAWAPVASWFRRRGAKVSMVPTTQSADLRAYYSKHTKNDHLDSKLLARLPLLHPEGLREHTGDGPAEPLRRAVKIRSSLVKRRTAVFQRLDAQLELLGPAWYDALGSNYGKAALAVLARYADPHSLIRLGQARLTRFLIRHSRGAWRDDHARALLTAAKQSLELWGTDAEAGIDFAELAADIAVEAEQARVLTEQIEDLDERTANLYAEADPTGIVASAPGVGPVASAIIVGRIGDPHRFHSLAAIRAYSGLVPKVAQSGQSAHQHGLTKAGDPLLREALFAAADAARRTDPQLAAKYKRLMETERHHDSAICHIATTLLTRIATCWRTRQHYVLRDTDGRIITPDEGRRIVRDRHSVDPKTRDKAAHARMSQRRKARTGRESQKSQSAPTSRPAKTNPTTHQVA